MQNQVKDEPLVSILIPYYNDRDFLRASIESVLSQTYQNFELFLLNHATTDDCREIARSYTDERIKHIDMKENLGGGSGLLLQTMLDQSSGKYIKILSADDEFRDGGLSTLVNYMENNPQVDFAFGNVEYIDNKGKDLGANWFTTREHFSVDNSIADCIRHYSRGAGFLPWAGGIITKSILQDIKINRTYMYYFDNSLWLSLLCKGYRPGYINDLVANYRIHEKQVSALGAVDKAMNFVYYESKTYYKLLFLLDDLELSKQIWPDSRFVDKLQDKRDIPFFIAHNLFIEQVFAGHSAEYIDDLLNNDSEREHLEEVFGYGIKEYREDIEQIMKKNKSKKSSNIFKNYKNKIYSTPVKQLRIRDMAYLLLRRFLHNITLADIRKKLFSKRKRYSL